MDDNEKTINMYDLMSSGKEIKLSEAIKNIVPQISINRITEMISEIPDDIISNIRKEYYITFIGKRYNECLLKVLKFL